MMKFSLKQLEIFVSVAELNSFTRAAEELYLTQSTVSAHISSLENALGVPLFSRGTRRSVQLTPQGQRLYPAAKRVLSDCRALDQLAANGGEDLPLLLGASTVPAQYVLPEMLAAFLRQHDGCRYSLRRGDSLQIHEFLSAGTVRIGFVGTALDPAGLQYDAVAEDRLVMVTANNRYYQEKKRGGVCGCELLGEPTVAREEGSGTDRTVVSYMRSRGFPESRLKIVARIDNPETIKSMVACGAGVSVLSAMAVRAEVQAGKLLSFEMDEAGLRRTIYMASRKNEAYSELEQQFMRSCRRYSGMKSPIE